MQLLTSDEQKLFDDAVGYVKTHTHEIIAKFTDGISVANERSISIFTAGSPGAGKTEFAHELATEHYSDAAKLIHIDADEIRKMMPGYTGNNSYVFQKAAVIGVEKLFNHAIETKKNCIVDGTFAYSEKARTNIQRSLSHGRLVLVAYVYQDPIRAWEFTKARELVEGRRVLKERFIEQFFGAPEVVLQIKKEFGDVVRLWVVTRDYNTKLYQIKTDASIDDLAPITYSKDQLEALLI